MPKELISINPTTYEVELAGGDKVEIGDKEAIDFKPHLQLNRWDGECFIKVGLPTAEKITPVIEAGKVKWREQKVETHLYPLEPRVVTAKDRSGRDRHFTQNELGGFEFEIILKEKPTSNQIVLNIETQGLKFHYQAELTPEEIEGGSTCPDNVVGSYAVYHATRTPFHKSKADADKYKCGKAFHIYRPKITDAEGNGVWGELYLDEQAGTLTIIIPQGFLDTAIYPVSIDPNFGYESRGAHARDIRDSIQGTTYTCPGSGIITSMSAVISVEAGFTFKLALYEVDPQDLVGKTVEGTSLADPNFTTLNIIGTPEVSAQAYILAAWAPSDVETIAIRYDELGEVNPLYYNILEYGEWPEPGGMASTGNNYKISIYCTYEAPPAKKKPTFKLDPRPHKRMRFYPSLKLG